MTNQLLRLGFFSLCDDCIQSQETYSFQITSCICRSSLGLVVGAPFTARFWEVCGEVGMPCEVALRCQVQRARRGLFSVNHFFYRPLMNEHIPHTHLIPICEQNERPLTTPCTCPIIEFLYSRRCLLCFVSLFVSLHQIIQQYKRYDTYY